MMDLKFLLIKHIKKSEIEIFDLLYRLEHLYLSPSILMINKLLLTEANYPSDQMRSNFQLIAENSNYSLDGNFSKAGESFFDLSNLYLTIQNIYSPLISEPESVVTAKHFLLGLTQLPQGDYNKLGPLRNESTLNYTAFLMDAEYLAQSDYDFTNPNTNEKLQVI
jgi:hypothetical protein